MKILIYLIDYCLKTKSRKNKSKIFSKIALSTLKKIKTSSLLPISNESLDQASLLSATLTLLSGQIIYPRNGLSLIELASIPTKKLKASHFPCSPFEVVSSNHQKQQESTSLIDVSTNITQSNSLSIENTQSILSSLSKNAIHAEMTELQYKKLENEKEKRRSLRSASFLNMKKSITTIPLIQSQNDDNKNIKQNPEKMWNESLKIVIDCGGIYYSSLMRRSEQSSLSLQLTHCYGF